MGIYLVVKFNFPEVFTPEDGTKAITLHQALQGQDWIQEVLTASGGIGGGPTSLWIFKLPNYAAIDKLFAGDTPVSNAYMEFFRAMRDVEDIIRDEITFTS